MNQTADNTKNEIIPPPSPGMDLHVHSTASDGSYPPEMLPGMAAEAGLAAIALTDHDTVSGIPAFLAAAQAYPGLEAIAGVELSAVYCSREMHFVGLFIDPDSEELQKFLNIQQQERKVRAENIKIKLASLGYAVTDEELVNAGAGETPGRPHFARALMDKYGFPDMAGVFDKLLKRNAPAYVPRRLPPPSAAIEAIHAAGGVAVWAHPVYRQRNERSWAKRIMRKFAPAGLDAVEAYYSLFGPEETAMIRELAELNGLALSGGSDFHGANTPHISLGRGAGRMHIPAELLPRLKSARQER